MPNEGFTPPVVGDHEIDGEHALQIRLLKAMEDALVRGDRAGALEVLAQLETVTEAHFAAEQILMRHHSYPAYYAHEREHGDLLEDLRGIRGRLESDSAEALPEEAHAVRRWLVSHLRGSDNALAAYLKNSPSAGLLDRG